VHPWGILIKNSTTYDLTNSGLFLISYYVQRKFIFTYGGKIKGNNSCGSKKSPGKKNSWRGLGLAALIAT
jgi:hypothetical protein